MNFPYQARGILSVFRDIIPFSVRLKLRKIHQTYVFKKAINRFRNHYHELDKFPTLLTDLVYGWGNMGWSSFQDYSRAIVEQALKSTGPVLECGSGLSTILLGIIGQERNFQVYSLEHHPAWAAHVHKRLLNLGIKSVTVFETPLKEYGNYDWYDVSKLPQLDSLQLIQLVICDGPPHDTKGGRYGLLPIMKKYLAKGVIILLDDYGREEEQRIVNDWSKMHALKVESMGKNDQYAFLTLFE